MIDVVDRQTRSRMMSGIRGKNTRPEMVVRSLIHRAGFRFRLHVRELPGRPDLALPRYRAVVFVHGCFWHGHGCHLFKWPSTRREFWAEKIRANRERDERAATELAARGWRVLVVWECALKGRERLDPEDLSRRIARWLKSEERQLELGAADDGGGGRRRASLVVTNQAPRQSLAATRRRATVARTGNGHHE